MVSRFKYATRNIRWLGEKEGEEERLNWDKFVRNFEKGTYRAQPKVYKILKQFSKDVKETDRIHGNIDENIFLLTMISYGTEQT